MIIAVAVAVTVVQNDKKFGYRRQPARRSLHKGRIVSLLFLSVHMSGSCQSAATSKIVNRCCSRAARYQVGYPDLCLYCVYSYS